MWVGTELYLNWIGCVMAFSCCVGVLIISFQNILSLLGNVCPPLQNGQLQVTPTAFTLIFITTNVESLRDLEPDVMLLQ